jgi:benzoyl-CoA reductase/2-hydroxyglutaryl-CoA dehydratase subunit BcrC/BadD/HgdB
MNIVLASQVMDKAEMNALLEKFIPELEDREPYEDRIRLMLIGSETHNTDLEELVEEVGGNVVIDELDNGSSSFWNDVIPHKDRLMSIGLRYLGRPHSALKDNNWRRRPQHIFELAEDYCVDGALVVKQLLCHPHGTDNYAVWKLLRERNIPFHFFERDDTLPADETRVRLEAFLNMLRPGLTRLRGWNVPLTL